MILDSSNICNLFFAYHTEDEIISHKKSSEISSSMIEMAYNPSLVPMDLEDFEDDFDEAEDNEDYEEYSF